jgi:hypothetical protein
MPHESLERLLAMVTDEELESLRDAILREEGRRRTQGKLAIRAPFPPLTAADDEHTSIVTRWARLLAWLAKDTHVPLAEGKRGVSIRLIVSGDRPNAQAAGIVLQEALVEAGLLLGRTPEWMDATTTTIDSGDEDRVLIELWEKPVPDTPWA